VHPLMMGLEEHLLGMFKDDFEFRDGAVPSHLGVGHTVAADEVRAAPVAAPAVASDIAIIWAADAEKELRKIPFFVRGKARRNTERFANENGLATITIETLYDAKAHYAR
jgi:light-independent protochlorophyllide reductase subunit B